MVLLVLFVLWIAAVATLFMSWSERFKNKRSFWFVDGAIRIVFAAVASFGKWPRGSEKAVVVVCALFFLSALYSFWRARRATE